MNDSTEELIVLWEAPKIEPPELRLYYDEQGKVICYTCEKLEGNYIVISPAVYAEARHDVRVIDGKITNPFAKSIVCKLMPSETEGMTCVAEDVSILVDKSYSGKTTKWKMKIYEL